jgi:hypothetical protein
VSGVVAVVGADVDVNVRGVVAVVVAMVAVGAALLGTRVVGSAWLVQFDQSAQRTAAARWAAANVIGSVDWAVGATATAPARTNAPSTADGQRRCLPRLRGACPGIVGVRRPRVNEVGAGSGVVCLPTMGLSRRRVHGSPGDDRHTPPSEAERARARPCTRSS